MAIEEFRGDNGEKWIEIVGYEQINTEVLTDGTVLRIDRLIAAVKAVLAEVEPSASMEELRESIDALRGFA